MLREALADLVSIDGPLLRSLVALTVPGRLTRLHVEGKRAPYLRPFRLYALASLLLFSSVLSLDAPDASDVNLRLAGETVGSPEPGQPWITVYDPGGSWTRELLGDRVAPAIERMKGQSEQEVIDGLFAGLRRALPLALIGFLPFLALALRLLYLRRGDVLYLDHLVTAVHFQSALFLALVGTWLVLWVAGIGVVWTLVTYALVALFILTVVLGLTLHRVYRQRWWLTVLKTAVLLVGYLQLAQLVVGLSLAWVVLLGGV